MLRRFSVNFALFSIGIDAFLVAAVLYLAVRLSAPPRIFSLTAARPPEGTVPWPLFFLFPVAWVGILLLNSIYDGRKNLRVIDEFTSLTISSFVAGVFLAGTLYLTFRDVPRLVFVKFVIGAYAAMVGWRVLARAGFRLARNNPVSQRRVLIVGAGPVGRRVQEQVAENPFMGLSLVGFLDDNTKKREQHPDIVGEIVDARRIIKREKVDDVVIALPQRAYERVNQLVTELHDLPVRVWVIPDYFHLALNTARVEEFAGLPMLDLRAPALNEYQRMTKRAFDLFLVLISLPFWLPLMGLIALAIRLEGPGPIFFYQKRVGENGRLFEMIKFRSMVPNAEELRHLVEFRDVNGRLIHKTVDDPRVTRVGRFLRRTSLDEFPQLINVLKGEMSLVGPRPELPYLVEEYEPWQRRRFAVPQGMTGWWQVNGRSDKPMHLHTEDDLYYVQNYSLMLDIRILLMTITTVLRGRGAY